MGNDMATWFDICFDLFVVFGICFLVIYSVFSIKYFVFVFFLIFWGVKTALCEITQIFDENLRRNNLSKWTTLGPIFQLCFSELHCNGDVLISRDSFYTFYSSVEEQMPLWLFGVLACFGKSQLSKVKRRSSRKPYTSGRWAQDARYRLR